MSRLPALLFATTVLASGHAYAAEDAYTLGQLEVTAKARTGEAAGGAVVTAEQIRTFDKVTVDQALDLIPGVAAGATGGSRNERLVFVRGFDRFQTTLSIDGVRVFLPADNRIDFGRFLTADLAEVQVSKGYVSVLDGPGGIGGAINLVTRKPTKLAEAEARIGVGTDADLGFNSYTGSWMVGGKTDKLYFQVSGAVNDRNHWSLPDSFIPRVPALEDGGERANSASNDWRVNIKGGWTPREGDEYSVTYTRQEGKKNAPLHVTDTASTRYWTWPYWNIDSVAFLSRTGLGERGYLKTRVYKNTFINLLSSFDNARQNTQTLGRAFNSYYDDNAWGGNVELGYDLTDTNTLKVAAFYRKDTHVEWQQSFPTGFTEPRQTTKEATLSLAVEDSQALSSTLDLVVGASWDKRDLQRAEEYNTNILFNYPLVDDDAWNAQGALIWSPDENTQYRASVSSRVRFPTLFERFSARFGAAIPNPDVKAERATNFELGARHRYGAVEVEGALFYSRLNNALIQIPVQLGAPFGVVNQTKNVGKGDYYGAEISVKAAVSPTLSLGGNYTYLHRELKDPTNPSFQALGTPKHKAFLYAEWKPFDRLSLSPNLEIASRVWTVTSTAAINPPRYYRTGGYVLPGLAANVVVTDNVDFTITGRNLLDAKYQLVDGFPEQGRNFRADLRMRF